MFKKLKSRKPDGRIHKYRFTLKIMDEQKQNRKKQVEQKIKRCTSVFLT